MFVVQNIEMTPHTCTVCGKGFSQSSTLWKHSYIHASESHYKCSVCGKVFSTSSNLKRHSCTYTGETPYTCTVCGKGFRQSSTLKKHSHIHAYEKPSMKTIYVEIKTIPAKRSFRTCLFCIHGFESSILLESHLSQNH